MSLSVSCSATLQRLAELLDITSPGQNKYQWLWQSRLGLESSSRLGFIFWQNGPTITSVVGRQLRMWLFAQRAHILIRRTSGFKLSIRTSASFKPATLHCHHFCISSS